MSDHSLLVRHLEDENNLQAHGCDNPLKPGQEETITKISSEVMLRAAEIGADEISISASSKRRAVETANNVASVVDSYGYPVGVHVDSRISEVGQGKFILPEGYQPGDFFPPLQDAWKAYFTEAFDQKDLYYRFGDPKVVNGIPKYPELQGHFKELGENHFEFSLRFYEFILDHLDISDANHKVLPVVVTHQAVASRICQLRYLASQPRADILRAYESGNLAFLEWACRPYTKIYSVHFSSHGGFYFSELTDLYLIKDILAYEIEYLKTKK